MNRREALAFRISAQQLDRPMVSRPVTDADTFDIGVQDTGRDGASWALANRGVPLANSSDLELAVDVALAWTLRGAPHFYRREDLPDILVATSPFSDKDAAKRVIGADKPLNEAGIRTLEGLAEVATQLRAVVSKPMTKGDVSTAVTKKLSAPYLRYCVPCGATHSWEQPFRLAALYAGVELEPGTSPPVMRRIPGWPKRAPGPAEDPLAAPERLHPVRNYLRFLGPATPNDVSAFLDAPVAEVKSHWPVDAIEVTVDGNSGWMLEGSEGRGHEKDLVRLLGGFDLFLQGRDRKLIVPDTTRHKQLWPVLGRPGAVSSGDEVIGTWRPKTTRGKFTLRLDLWNKISKAVRDCVEAEAERLAAHRGLVLAGIDQDG